MKNSMEFSIFPIQSIQIREPNENLDFEFEKIENEINIEEQNSNQAEEKTSKSFKEKIKKLFGSAIGILFLLMFVGTVIGAIVVATAGPSIGRNIEIKENTKLIDKKPISQKSISDLSKKYEMIEDGMTYKEVCKILGRPGITKKHTDSDEHTSSSYYYTQWYMDLNSDGIEDYMVEVTYNYEEVDDKNIYIYYKK